MANTKIPKNLPDCELLHVLADKAGQRHDIDFNFFGKLDDFRQRVSGEVRQINELFTEYTPHDEQYHLKRLFHVADTVLGKNLLEEMNSAELFILAISLYGHDWGMAVSDPEKQYIITGKLPDGANLSDLWILRDEQTGFANFIRNQRLTTDVEDHVKQIPTEMWRDYVRETHAFRSAERVRRFFEPIDRGVAEGASRVCVGHWLNFEDLQDYRSYPPDFSVLRETVNLRALAVYVRLIDVLDLAEDRTPYVIWKFVAPRDPRSKMEWEKHRSLQPVTTPQYQNGRIIQVDGSTEDHEVYAALEDLRIWCEEQLRGCNDVLARMNDSRHKLDLYHIEWRVAPRGFSPVSIRFEFKRERMFEVLSDEIYQGNPYVFLRELLQNSIDAIRMRREVLQRNGVAPGALGVIRVTAEHLSGGDAVITWQDDGIGMDEYIIRNYLAVAGQSYYRSTDFEREGLTMDPISRFGIGILSCFMDAERIEIETFKDPYLPPHGDPLKIIIPAMRRQFRIETRPQEGAQVGTTVKVFVDGNKIPSDDENQPAKPLNVTEYLSYVAGFVEFPIVVIEGDTRTVILHPYQDTSEASRRFGAEYSIKQLDIDYPWEEAVLPQDLATAREVFRVEKFDLRKDLGLEEYEGVFSYPVPVDNSTDFNKGENETTVLAHRNANLVGQSVRWRRGWRGCVSFNQRWWRINEVEVSDDAIYRDGILLPKASFRFPAAVNIEYVESADALQLVINVPKSRAEQVDLARTKVIGPSRNWVEPIFRVHLQRLSDLYFKDLIDLPPAERLRRLAWFVAFHNVSVNRLWDVFPREYWPLPFLRKGGLIDILLWPEVANSVISVTPEPITRKLTIAMSNLFSNKQTEKILSNWSGEQCLVDFATWPDTSVTLRAILGFVRWPLGTTHQFSGIRFLSPPWHGNPPLLQEVWFPMELKEGPSSKEMEGILVKAMEAPATLNEVESVLFYSEMSKLLRGHWYSAKIAHFPPPFDKSFAYEDAVINLNHPVTQAFIRLIAKVILLKMKKQAIKPNIRNVEDMLRMVFHNIPDRYGRTTYKKWSRDFYDLWCLVKEMQLIDIAEMENTPTEEEFVPGSSTFLDIKVRDDWNEPFGEVLG